MGCAIRIVLSLCLALPASGAAWAQNFDEGVRKYKNGDYQGALREFQPLAQRGDSYSQNYLGIMYERRYGVGKNEAEGVKWYKKAAEQGIDVSQFNPGLMYCHGKGIGVNLAEAAKWYRRSAEQGYVGAQINLGAMYEHGEGVIKS